MDQRGDGSWGYYLRAINIEPYGGRSEAAMRRALRAHFRGTERCLTREFPTMRAVVINFGVYSDGTGRIVNLVPIQAAGVDRCVGDPLRGLTEALTPGPWASIAGSLEYVDSRDYPRPGESP